MTRNIQSIKVQGNTVYVNFEDGTFGTRRCENGTWKNHRLSDAELTAAKKLAVKGGKWTNWTAPRQSARCATGKSIDQWTEGPLTTERDEREVAAKMVVTRTSEY